MVWAFRLFRTVVAAIDVKTGAIKVGKGRGQSQVLGSSDGNEIVEFRHPASYSLSKAHPRVSSLRWVASSPGTISRWVGLL